MQKNSSIRSAVSTELRLVTDTVLLLFHNIARASVFYRQRKCRLREHCLADSFMHSADRKSRASNYRASLTHHATLNQAPITALMESKLSVATATRYCKPHRLRVFAKYSIK